MVVVNNPHHKIIVGKLLLGGQLTIYLHDFTVQIIEVLHGHTKAVLLDGSTTYPLKN
jgi:hypothetical protein